LDAAGVLDPLLGTEAMDFDPVLLARLQFAFTIAFHIIFPSFTIGLSAYIATLHVTAWLTGRDRFLRIARFWTKIFAVSFGMGVVSGVVLSYELGTNWSRFSRVAGNIVGPLAGYEVLSAFFLEASFLAILLFGGKRVPRWLHVLSAVIVAIGTATSAFWIISANSWMHTPTGHEMRDGVAFPLDWWEIVFNPSATVAGLSKYLWKLEQPAHAVANGYFVGAINRVGTEAPWNIGKFYGSSYFVNPRGQFVAEGSEDGDELVIGDLDLSQIDEVRNTWQFYRDRRPDAYREITKMTGGA
jgi:hypothetical protein